MLKTESCPHGFPNFIKARSPYQDLIKQYRLSKDCGNQTSLVSTTATGAKRWNCNWYRKWSNRKRWGERGSLLQAFCYTWEQKTTQYCQLAIIKEATDRRNGARKPKSKERNRATTARVPVGVRAGARKNRTSSPARRVTFTTATTTAARTGVTTTTTTRTRVTTTTTRTSVTSKDATSRRWTASSTAWLST